MKRFLNAVLTHKAVISSFALSSSCQEEGMNRYHHSDEYNISASK